MTDSQDIENQPEVFESILTKNIEGYWCCFEPETALCSLGCVNITAMNNHYILLYSI